jgi:hypothetical protein
MSDYFCGLLPAPLPRFYHSHRCISSVGSKSLTTILPLSQVYIFGGQQISLDERTGEPVFHFFNDLWILVCACVCLCMCVCVYLCVGVCVCVSCITRRSFLCQDVDTSTWSQPQRARENKTEGRISGVKAPKRNSHVAALVTSTHALEQSEVPTTRQPFTIKRPTKLILYKSELIVNASPAHQTVTPTKSCTRQGAENGVTTGLGSTESPNYMYILGGSNEQGPQTEIYVLDLGASFALFFPYFARTKNRLFLSRCSFVYMVCNVLPPFNR